MEHKLVEAASRLPEPELEFDVIRLEAKQKNRRFLTIPAAIAACLALVLSLGLGSYAYAAEAKEYNAAVQFFQDYGLSTEGLSRGRSNGYSRISQRNPLPIPKLQR